MLHQLLHVGRIQRFVFEERPRDRIHFGAVLDEEFLGTLIGGIDQMFDFRIDQAGRILTVTTGTGHVPGQEHMFVIVTVFDHAEAVAHPPLADHLAGDLGGVTDVSHGSVGDIPKDQFFGHPAAHGDHQIIQQLIFAVGILVLFRQPHG